VLATGVVGVAVCRAGAGDGAALVAHAAAEFGDATVIGDDHASFAGGDLLVGIEAKDTGGAEGAGSAAVEGGAEGFAAIFDEGDAVTIGDAFVGIHVGGVAEGGDSDDGLGAWGDGGFELGGVHVEGDGVDIDKDGSGTDHEDAVAAGDEGVGSGDDFVAGADAEGGHEEVKAAGATVDSDAEAASDAACDEGFELFDHGADGEATGAEGLQDQGLFEVGDVGLGEGDGREGGHTAFIGQKPPPGLGVFGLALRDGQSQLGMGVTFEVAHEQSVRLLFDGRVAFRGCRRSPAAISPTPRLWVFTPSACDPVGLSMKDLPRRA